MGSLSLLQSDVLSQLISAVIAGVAPVAKVAFAEQQTRGDAVSGDSEDPIGSSEAKKQTAAVHSLLWSASCGGLKGAAVEGLGGDLPMP